MNFILPKNILNIISIINNGGYEAHIVGGCVRDIVLNKAPTDWDITTNAKPETIKGLFKKTFDTGIKHGTVTVLVDDFPVEVTTWRKESGYSDHRRPDFVTLTDSLTHDLSRRDFTMNAIAFHPNKGLIDPFNGFDDIKKRIIRCVGNPYNRFSEDALRMLRAIRFSAQLNFDIEKNTLLAIKQIGADLIHISKERIQAEINKMLESDVPQRIALIWETELNKVIFPEIENLPLRWCDLIKTFIGSEYQKVILLALLFYLSCKTEALSCAANYLNNHKYDNKTRHSVASHIKCFNNIGPLTQRNMRKAATEYGISVTQNIIQIVKAINSAYYGEHNFPPHLIENISPVILNISGSDIKELGLEGKNIKSMLEILSHCLFENPDLNSKEILLELAKHLLELPGNFIIS